MEEMGQLWMVLYLLALCASLFALGLAVQGLRIHSLRESLAINGEALRRQRAIAHDLVRSNRDLYAELRGKALHIEQLERRLALLQRWVLE